MTACFAIAANRFARGLGNTDTLPGSGPSGSGYLAHDTAAGRTLTITAARDCRMIRFIFCRSFYKLLTFQYYFNLPIRISKLQSIRNKIDENLLQSFFITIKVLKILQMMRIHNKFSFYVFLTWQKFQCAKTIIDNSNQTWKLFEKLESLFFLFCMIK